MTKANGYTCFECSTLTVTPEREVRSRDWPDDCSNCGADVVTFVFTSPCPEVDPAKCDDETHHWGRGQHEADIEV